MGQKLMAIVAEGTKGRVFLSPIREQEIIATSATPTWKPDGEFFQQALGFRIGNYGMTQWSHLFSRRQLVALTTFSDLVIGVRELIQQDAVAADLAGNKQNLAIEKNWDERLC
jgi:putative DNA methylase